MHPLLRLFASRSGRLRRRTYWWAALALTIVFAAFFALIEKIANRETTLLLYPFFLWGAAVLMIKRLHDRDRSAWWLLLLLVPVLGPLWIFLALAFGRGTRGENRYGEDPRTANAGYLTVRINA